MKETLTYSNYEIIERPQSKIDPSQQLYLSVGFTCPKCKTKNYPSIEHGESRICGVCKLKMTRHGNALECEIPEVSDIATRMRLAFLKLLNVAQRRLAA